MHPKLLLYSIPFWFATPLLLATTLLGGSEDLRQRRERLQSMSAAEKEELQRKERRFHDLSPTEQEHLRELHQQITGSQDSEKLQEVLTRYYAWLKTLRPGERAEVLSIASPDERIAKIRGMLEEQSIQRFQRMAASQLEHADVTFIFRWIHEYVSKHETELLAALAPEQRTFAENNPRARRFILTGALLRRDSSTVEVSNEEVQNLIAGLSRPAQQILEKEKDNKQRIRIIRGWMDAAVSSMFRNGGRPTPPVSHEEIMKFLEKELNDRDREYLDGLPSERFRREAERLYYYYKYRRERESGDGPGEPGRFRPFRPGGDSHNGPPREPRGEPRDETRDGRR